MSKLAAIVMALASYVLFVAGTQQASAQAILTIVDEEAGVRLDLDEQALLELPQTEFRTSTIWTTGDILFSGPRLADVLELAKVGPGKLVLSAVNDYSVEMPRRFVGQDAPIVAIRMNGKPFSLREKGPLWVVFPYDSADEFKSPQHYAFSVWQLSGIQVTPADS